MVKVPFENNKNRASYKRLVRNSEKKQNFLNFGMWNFRKSTSCAAMY